VISTTSRYLFFKSTSPQLCCIEWIIHWGKHLWKFEKGQEITLLPTNPHWQATLNTSSSTS